MVFDDEELGAILVVFEDGAGSVALHLQIQILRRYIIKLLINSPIWQIIHRQILKNLSFLLNPPRLIMNIGTLNSQFVL